MALSERGFGEPAQRPAPSTARPLARDLRVLIGWPLPFAAALAFWSGRALATTSHEHNVRLFLKCHNIPLPTRPLNQRPPPCARWPGTLGSWLAGHCPWVLVWAGACYWHGMGGFMFNSSSSPCHHAKLSTCASMRTESFGFVGAGGRFPKARRGRVYCTIHHHQ